MESQSGGRSMRSPWYRPFGCPRVEDCQPHAELGVRGFEQARRAEDLMRQPGRIGDVDDEPPLGHRWFDRPETPLRITEYAHEATPAEP